MNKNHEIFLYKIESLFWNTIFYKSSQSFNNIYLFNSSMIFWVSHIIVVQHFKHQIIFHDYLRISLRTNQYFSLFFCSGSSFLNQNHSIHFIHLIFIIDILNFLHLINLYFIFFLYFLIYLIFLLFYQFYFDIFCIFWLDYLFFIEI